LELLVTFLAWDYLLQLSKQATHHLESEAPLKKQATEIQPHYM